MENDKLKSLSTEKLKARKRTALFISVLCLLVFAISLAILIKKLVDWNHSNLEGLYIGMSLPFFAVLMLVGVRKINRELEHRKKEERRE